MSNDILVRIPYPENAKAIKFYRFDGETYRELIVTEKPKYSDSVRFEWADKLVTQEDMKAQKRLQKIDDRFLNEHGKYIKNFVRIIRTTK